MGCICFSKSRLNEGICSILSSSQKQDVVFDAPAGKIIGWQSEGVLRATGIAYARASRFSPPQPLGRSKKNVEATQWSPACPQIPVPELDALLGVQSPTLPESEDCLNLSVTVPKSSTAKPRPVMVWIHGGSYVAGAGDTPIFDVGPLCREQDVVVVSVTYRLGLMGFLGGYGGRPGNLGILDIIEALRWVKKNISAFGGDPENITLFGESAGGDAIAHLIIAEGVEGLFHRTIIQSAPLGIREDRSDMQEAMGRVAEEVGEYDSIDKLLEVQQKVIETGNRFGLKGGMPFSPQYGQFPLPKESEAEAEWKKRALHFDVLIGYNEEETSLFLYAMPKLLQLTRLPLIGWALKKAFVSKTTTKIYGRPALDFARRHSQAGGKAWQYVLNWGKQRTFLGACHTVELPLLFGGWETWKKARLIEGIPKNQIDEDGPKLRHLWASFARDGTLEPLDGQLDGILRWEKT